ncbi:MAG: MFS transporter [Syntrophomonadaceae bacterium]|nr:MFS transporter [Syntrophomonadaceae bacterium]
MYKDTLRFKISLLSVSLLTLMAGAAVAPGLSEINRVFAGYSPTVVKLVISLPPLLIIPFSLLSGLLSSVISKKNLLIAGLLIYLVGGAGAAFVDSMLPLLLFRAVLGMGTGIILPLSTGLIADFYDGDQRSKMLGFSSASNCLGTILANLAAGILVAINWHYIFYVYFLAIPVLLMVIPFIEGQAPPSKVAGGKVSDIPKELILWALAAFLVMLAFFGVVTNLALLIDNRNLGGSQVAGIVFALNSLCMLLSGAFFLNVQKKLQMFYSSFMLFLMAAGYAGLMLAGSLPLLIVSVILSGLGTGLAFPFIMNQASRYAREDNSIVIMGIVSSSAFLGQFFSPLILDNVPNITGSPLSNIFLALAFGTGIICIINLARSISRGKHELKGSSQENWAE